MDTAEIPHPPGLVHSESVDLFASLSEAPNAATNVLKDVRYLASSEGRFLIDIVIIFIIRAFFKETQSRRKVAPP